MYAPIGIMKWTETNSSNPVKLPYYPIRSGVYVITDMALALVNHRRWETESCGRMLRVAGIRKRKAGGMIRRELVLVG
jgi:hypothetical protein